MGLALLALLASCLCLSASAYSVVVADMRVTVTGEEGGNSERIPYPQVLEETLLLEPLHTLQVCSPPKGPGKP